jgi:L-rhamnose isomerase/sugar isomerase
MDAYELDVQPLLKIVRVDMGRDPDPILAYRVGGYADKIARERAGAGIGVLGG